MAILYGMGNHLQSLLKKYMIPLSDVEVIIDNNKKHHWISKELQVITWEDFLQNRTKYHSNEIVICTYNFYEDIRKAILRTHIFSESNIFYINEWAAKYPLRNSLLESIFTQQEAYEKNERFLPDLYNITDKKYEPRILSKCCNESDFRQSWFTSLEKELRPYEHKIIYDRKDWEYIYCIKALSDLGSLRPQMKGLGFAVGTEPLPSYFASKGIYVTATDLGSEDGRAHGWACSNANANGDIDKLWKPTICTREAFDSYCTFKGVDMNNIPDDLSGYDFCWSICAIEHVGTLERSKNFLKNMIRVLKPGGIAFHSTEFNIVSNERTIESGGTVLFRKKDIEEIAAWMDCHHCDMEISWCRGDLEGDQWVDIPPYTAQMGQNGNLYHLLLQVEDYVATSFAMIIHKRA